MSKYWPYTTFLVLIATKIASFSPKTGSCMTPTTTSCVLSFLMVRSSSSVT
ncbi:hypothetical protein PF004_g8266 [Phytophthora fragariae]|uniref:RxLR effector protein n=1 Tax=Phytophthora fragariae TaxID=53985 RepID=A0A6G0P7M0_9STRA|nr:hypothetical protein PF004_g8266 [Phytophthora fragariae]